MLATSLLTDPRQLSELRPAWEQLASRSDETGFAVHPSWLLPWWDVFGGEGKRSLRCLAFHDGGRLVGLAPLLARRHVYRGAIPFRRLELLGTGEAQADETCGDYLGLVVEAGREADVVDAFARALARDVAGPWDELVLGSMNGQRTLPERLVRAFEACGFGAKLDVRDAAPYVPLPKTWGEYLGALKQSKRSQLRRAMRECETWAGGEPRIVRVTSANELAEGKRVLVSLHQERWASGGVFASPRFRDYHDRAMPELLACGMLDLGWLVARGEPVAAFYNIRSHGRISFYQAGRRLDIPAKARLGISMHAYLIRAAIADGYREYDFLAGVSQYKMGLALATRPISQVRIARRSLRERARTAGEEGVLRAKEARDWLQARPLPEETPARVREVVESLRKRL